MYSNSLIQFYRLNVKTVIKQIKYLKRWIHNSGHSQFIIDLQLLITLLTSNNNIFIVHILNSAFRCSELEWASRTMIRQLLCHSACLFTGMPVWGLFILFHILTWTKSFSNIIDVIVNSCFPIFIVWFQCYAH